MANILSRIRNFCVATALAVASASCSYIFEDPDDCCQPMQQINIKLHYRINFNDIGLEVSRASSETMRKRCVVQAFKTINGSRSTSRMSDTPDVETRYAFARDDFEEQDLELQLTPGTWEIKVWIDYVDDATGFAFYDCSDFSQISLLNTERHYGCTDYRDAFRGYGTLTIDDQTLGSNVSIDIEMTRPLAKYRFITTDINEFIENQGANIDLSLYTVRFYYTGFMPSVFNEFTDRSSDAQTGVWYDGYIQRISDSEAEIGFDYVFVNESSTTVPVAVAVYDRYGQQISVTSAFDVPLQRNQVTTVRSKFLSSTSGYGATINPGYAGSYNIVIN